MRTRKMRRGSEDGLSDFVEVTAMHGMAFEYEKFIR
jgi:hypothetical protein